MRLKMLQMMAILSLCIIIHTRQPASQIKQSCQTQTLANLMSESVGHQMGLILLAVLAGIFISLILVNVKMLHLN
jgi:hypothetical protein